MTRRTVAKRIIHSGVRGALSTDAGAVHLNGERAGLKIDTSPSTQIKGNRLRIFCEPVWQICELLESRHGDVCAAEMAAIIGRSGRQSREIFSRIIGESFRTAQLRARLTPARASVLGTSKPISEIARHLGYTVRSKFDKSYTRLFGITPAADRLQASRKLDQKTATQGIDSD